MPSDKITLNEKIKGFLKRFIDNLDKKMEAKAKSSCCCKPGQDKDKTCCSG